MFIFLSQNEFPRHYLIIVIIVFDRSFRSTVLGGNFSSQISGARKIYVIASIVMAIVVKLVIVVVQDTLELWASRGYDERHLQWAQR